MRTIILLTVAVCLSGCAGLYSGLDGCGGVDAPNLDNCFADKEPRNIEYMTQAQKRANGWD